MFRKSDLLFLHVNGALREKHDYRKDTAHDGRYLMRLPDRTLVYSDQYEEKLAEYEARARREPDAD
ncbi:MAG: hypothetical protein AAGE01_09435 [Pseudomonadota bacterium]